MPFTQFTSLDFDEIKAQIRAYLRANSNFSDFDFEGSNFSVLIDTLAYNTYINSFNANLVANESFLDSANIRENVVSLARNIGYIPRSKSSAEASIYFDVQTDSTEPILYLKPGLVCVGAANNTTYRFSVSQPLHAAIKNGVASFGTAESPVSVFQGTVLEVQFLANTSTDQRFLLQNPNIDASSIKVFVSGAADDGIGREYAMIDNILNINKTSEVFFIQEVQDEKYEILFGDGYFGKKLENNSIITVRYIVTDGAESNGASAFSFQGVFTGKDPNTAVNPATVIPTAGITINTVNGATNGADMEEINSIKYFAPRLYSAQYRACLLYTSPSPRD